MTDSIRISTYIKGRNRSVILALSKLSLSVIELVEQSLNEIGFTPGTAEYLLSNPRDE